MKHTEFCEECMRLSSDVINSLHSLTELTVAQLAAFRAKDQNAVRRIDRARKRAGTTKDRAVRAQRRHMFEHGNF